MGTRFDWLGKQAPVLAGLLCLALVVLLQLANPAALERVRLQTFDAFQQASPMQYEGAPQVAIVDIDEASIERLGQWPWPRTDLAEITRRLRAAGAGAVVFDIVFSEQDRTSPALIAQRYRQMGQDDILGPDFANLPSHDAMLAQSFGQARVVTGFFLDRENRGRDVEPKMAFTLHGSMPFRGVGQYEGSLQPLAELEAAAAGNGFVSLESDADGIVRRVPLVAIHRGTLIPALSLEAVRVALDGGSPNLLTSDGSGETSGAPGAAVAVRLDGREIPVNDAGEMWVHFPDPARQTMLPAWPIVTGDVDGAALREAVEGRIVFIGGSAVGLQDLTSTPLSERIAGVTVHAAAAQQILTGHFLERPDWAPGLEMVLVILLGAALALMLPRLGAAKGAAAALAAIAAIIGGSWLAFTRANYLLDPTYPVLVIAVIYAVQTVAVFYREERQRSYIHAAFDRYLSPEMVRQIAADPGKLELGGEEKEMSVLMCDIRGFSRISEQYSPRQVIDFLINFLTPVSDILLAQRATLDKYIGDAVLAFWNAPLDDPDHHANAARSALAIVAKTEELNRTMMDSSGQMREGVVWPGEVKIGIGLNSGLCCVGNMGSRQRLSYSLIGDTVNVAARLEGLTKAYGVPIITGRDLAEHLQGRFALLGLDLVRVVGRERPEEIFALLGDETVLDTQAFQRLHAAHAAMLAKYRSGRWDKAKAALTAALPAYEAFGIKGLHQLFSDRIEALHANPPAEDWGGVFQATQK